MMLSVFGPYYLFAGIKWVHNGSFGFVYHGNPRAWGMPGIWEGTWVLVECVRALVFANSVAAAFWLVLSQNRREFVESPAASVLFKGFR